MIDKEIVTKVIEKARLLMRGLENTELYGNREVDLLTISQLISLAQLFLDDELVEAGKADVMSDDRVFISHIQAHLPEAEVLCKICGKSAKEIIKTGRSKA